MPGRDIPERQPVPRLLLRPERSGAAPLDGGWWPRSDDPAAELPGLIPALDERHGRITRVMLGTAGWNSSRPRLLYLSSPEGSRVVKVGWFATMPAGLLTATSRRGQRTDLLIVPPDTGEQAAQAAMEQAAQAGNRSRTPALLAAMARPGRPAAVIPAQNIQLSTWEWEGGQLRDRTPPAASVGPPATLLPAAGPRQP